MKINWLVRFKNPVFVTTFMTTVVAFIYTILGMFGIVPAVTENMVMQAVTVVVEIFTVIGILTDPTTAGMSDSNRAMRYTEPRRDNE